MSLVTLEVSSEQIATVSFNDPDRRNAMSVEMADEFAGTIEKLKHNHNLRAVIVTGQGTAFAAGGDLQMLKQKSKLDAVTNARLMLDFYNSFLCMLDLPVPLIAAINGHAIGAGLCVALACDVRIVSTEARLGLTFVKLGLHPGMGATCFLPRIAGTAVANDLLISGRIFDSHVALKMGLVSAVHPAGEVVDRAISVARSYLASGPQAVSGLLQTLRPSTNELQRCLRREAEQQGLNYESEQFLEGVAAAIEKRVPDFS